MLKQTEDRKHSSQIESQQMEERVNEGLKTKIRPWEKEEHKEKV